MKKQKLSVPDSVPEDDVSDISDEYVPKYGKDARYEGARYDKSLEDMEKELDESVAQRSELHVALRNSEKAVENLRNIVIWERNKANKAVKMNEKLEEENKELKEYQAWAKKTIGEREDTILDLKVEIADYVEQNKKQEEKNEQIELEIEELMKLKCSMETTLELTRTALENVKNKLEVTRTASHVYQRGQKRGHEEYAHETSMLKHMLSEEKSSSS